MQVTVVTLVTLVTLVTPVVAPSVVSLGCKSVTVCVLLGKKKKAPDEFDVFHLYRTAFGEQVLPSRNVANHGCSFFSDASRHGRVTDAQHVLRGLACTSRACRRWVLSMVNVLSKIPLPLNVYGNFNQTCYFH